MTLSDAIIDAAQAGLLYAAERQGLSLAGYDSRELARVAAVRASTAATNSGVFVAGVAHDARLEQDRLRIQRWTNRACAAEVALDRLRCELQRVLSEVNDGTARQIAKRVGVLLLPARAEETA